MHSSAHPALNTLATRWRACSGEVPPPLVGAAAVVVDEDHLSSMQRGQASTSSHQASALNNNSSGRMFLFAGRLASNRRMTNSLYCLELDSLVWSKVPSSPFSGSIVSPEEKPTPKYPTPRYFHSCDLWKGKLVFFGGMASHPKPPRSDAIAPDGSREERGRPRVGDNSYVMDEVLLFDLATMQWDREYVPRAGSVRGPAPRYAHLSAITGDLLVVMGGQNIHNKYVEEINVFDLVKRQWTLCETLARQCGSYRSLSVSSPWVVEGRLRAPSLVGSLSSKRRSISKSSISALSSINAPSSSSIGRPRGFSNVSSMTPYDAISDNASAKSAHSVGSTQGSRRPGIPESQSTQDPHVSFKGTPPAMATSRGHEYGRKGEETQRDDLSAPSLPVEPVPMSRPLTRPDDNPPLYVYSNYNFTDVKRELEVIRVSNPRKANGTMGLSDEYGELPSLTLEDQSSLMQGLLATAGLPPGLRFPTGIIVGHYLLVSGTYLANTSQAFSVWALYLPKLIWSRLDMGPLINQGSWNRATVSLKRSQLFVFGNRERDLVEDYNHRQSNWDHVLTLDLEAWGICQPPPRPMSDDGIALGLRKLETAMASSVYQSAAQAFARQRSVFSANVYSVLDSKVLFSTDVGGEAQDVPLLPGVCGTGGDLEIVCSDGVRIGCDRVVLEKRWPWFHEKMERYRTQVKAAADLIRSRREEDRTSGRPYARATATRAGQTTKERAFAAMQSAASEEDSQLQYYAPAANRPVCAPSTHGSSKFNPTSDGHWRETPRQLYLSEPSAVVLALLEFLYTQCICTPLQRHPSIVASLLVFSRLYDLEDTLGRWARHAAHVLLGCDLVPDILGTAGSFAEADVLINTPKGGESTNVIPATSGVLKDVPGLMATAEPGCHLSVEEAHRFSLLLYEAAGMAGYEALQVRAMRNILVLLRFMQRQSQIIRPQEQMTHNRSSSHGNNSSTHTHGSTSQAGSSSSLVYPRRPAEPVRASTSNVVPVRSEGVSVHGQRRRPGSSGDVSLAHIPPSRRPLTANSGDRLEYSSSVRLDPARPTSSSQAERDETEYMSSQQSFLQRQSEETGSTDMVMGRPRGNSKADRVLGSGGDKEEGGYSGDYYPRKNTGSSLTSVTSSGTGGLAGVGGASRKRFSLFGRGGIASGGGNGSGSGSVGGQDGSLVSPVSEHGSARDDEGGTGPMNSSTL